jgi:hypothetical protein
MPRKKARPQRGQRLEEDGGDALEGEPADGAPASAARKRRRSLSAQPQLQSAAIGGPADQLLGVADVLFCAPAGDPAVARGSDDAAPPVLGHLGLAPSCPSHLNITWSPGDGGPDAPVSCSCASAPRGPLHTVVCCTVRARRLPISDGSPACVL